MTANSLTRVDAALHAQLCGQSGEPTAINLDVRVGDSGGLFSQLNWANDQLLTALLAGRSLAPASRESLYSASLAGHHMQSSIPRMPAKGLKLLTDHRDAAFIEGRRRELSTFVKRMLAVPHAASVASNTNVTPCASMQACVAGAGGLYAYRGPLTGAFVG